MKLLWEIYTVPQKTNLETTSKMVLDSIQNIKPDLYQSLIDDILTSEVRNSKKAISYYVQSKLNITKGGKNTRNYWLARGWNNDESFVKSKENKRKNCKSVYSQKTWTDKINPVTGVNYTPEEADYERNSRRPIRKEYWIKKGHSEEDAIQLAIETKFKNNKSGAQKGISADIRRATSKRCVEFYTARGYSIDEAKELVSENQKYFSKDICIQKYGEDEGIKIWQDRQHRWQETLNAKSPEEKDRINRLKLYKNGTISTSEKKLLESIRSNIPDCIHQFSIKNSDFTRYVYDFMYNNKIIEFNGDFWHCNPLQFSSDFVNPVIKKSAKEIWDKDLKKIQFAENQNFKVLVVWESDFKKNQKEVIEQCIQFLTQ